MTYYVTGDTHGDFRHITYDHFKNNRLHQEDTLIILGDSGFNYSVIKKMSWEIDAQVKRSIRAVNITSMQNRLLRRSSIVLYSMCMGIMKLDQKRYKGM